MSNDSIVKAHAAAVRMRIAKIIQLRSDGMTFPQLAERFNISENFIKRILKEAQS